MRQLTHGSLFAGIGGFDLGFERAGMKTIWQVEIDEYCRRVLREHFPDAYRHGDIRLCCGKDPIAGNHFHRCNLEHLEPVDVLSGGFPCQDISNANREQLGLDGKRSGLWFEYARIIDELRPDFVVVENVAALLVRGLERVLGSLAEIGYDAEWECIPASAIGAWHKRERIWIVAYPNGKHGNNGGCNSGEILRERRRPAELSGCKDVAHAHQARLEGRVFGSERSRELLIGARSRAEQGIWSSEPNVGRVANGVSRRVDRLKGLGNAIVPQIAEFIGRRIIEVSQGLTE